MASLQEGKVLVVGGTSAIGKEVARHFAAKGHPVIVTSRDAGRANGVAAELPGNKSTGLALDLSQPEKVAATLKDIDDIQHVVLVAVVRNMNSITSDKFDLQGATDLVMVKTVGYTSVIHAVAPRMRSGGSICVFGGMAKDRPYNGSTVVSTVNGAVHAMIHSMAIELAQTYNIRINAVHPGLVGDSPHYKDNPGILAAFQKGTPLPYLVSIADVVHATVFLLENRSLTGVNLNVNAGFELTSFPFLPK